MAVPVVAVEGLGHEV